MFDAFDFTGYKETRYRFINEVGRGAQGRVWKAADRMKGDRLVAIKTLDAILDREDVRHLVAALENEARLMARIPSHDHVVEILDVRPIEGHVAIVMELLDMGLHTFLRERDPASPNQAGTRRALSPGEVVDAGAQIFDGLAEAHQISIVHRDIKPQNILVSVSQDGRKIAKAKIGDWGVAASLEMVSKAATFCGTPPYMSPEMLRGEGVDHLADIYSAGVTLYEMATGVMAFQGGVQNIAALIREGRFRPIEHVNPVVPTALAEIVTRAMCRDRRGRYQSAAEVARDLRTWAERALPEKKLERATNAQPQEAEQIYLEVIEEEPQALEAYVRLGRLLSRMGRCREAARIWRSALRARGDLGPVYFMLARELQKLGELRSAKEHYQKALEYGELTSNGMAECKRQLALIHDGRTTRTTIRPVQERTSHP